MNDVLRIAADKASRKRDWMIRQARQKGPSAAFNVGLVRISQAIDRARKTGDDLDAVRSSMGHVLATIDDIDARYDSEKEK